ncbi:cytochrome P450 [Wenjunlia tyrosinilytica]|uniref:Cytochrome P450 n=1 Tax=Wenjunlia tyrosinilytica TaxID=1544741 RepID=A0A917ZYI3_9ACTN|nr:cytochrome P450 [Wenjunlia tyrosinilytica]GGP00696.1 cytochrome P450 [Wenjunlia tyrosinilytica]
MAVAPGTEATAPPEVSLDGGESLLAWLRRMRAEQPVWRDAAGKVHVFRHEDIQRIVADPAAFSSDTVTRLSGGERQPPGGTLLLLDPPRHGKLRRLVSKVFTAKMVSDLAPRITQVATELLDGIDAARDDRFDVVESFANPLPVIVISSMLGVPPSDRPLFQVWADNLLTVDWETPEGMEVMGRTVQELDAYLRKHVTERREQERDDLISTLVRAEVDGETLNDDDVVSFAALLLLAGHVTTAVLLGNMLLSLDLEPELPAELRADRSRIPAFTEEVLRYRPPFLKIERVPTADTKIAGELVAENTMMYLWLLSANRDEQVFAEPDRFLTDRPNAKQMAFGHGIHYCLGAPLARMEGQIALNLMLDRYADIQVDHGTGLSYFDNRVNVFGLRQLPVSVRRV